MSRHALFTSFALLIGLTAGCGGAAPPGSAPPGADARIHREAHVQVDGAPAAGGKPPADAPAVQRKIIYSGSVEVIVKDLDTTVAEVERIVAEHKGYVAKSEVTGTTGTRRTATWTLKVPAEKFRTVVAALAALGSPVRNASDSQDVTEEYVDLEARVKNMRVEEDALNKMMAEPGLTLDNRIRIRSEVAKVRGDVERSEGRLKYLATMAAMSTITLTVREDAAYTPPDPAAAPTFADRVSGTFGNSLATLQDFGEGVALLAVALAPWLPVIMLGLLVLRWMVKRIAAAASSDRPHPRAARPVMARPLPSAPAEPPPTPPEPPATA